MDVFSVNLKVSSIFIFDFRLMFESLALVRFSGKIIDDVCITLGLWGAR